MDGQTNDKSAADDLLADLRDVGSDFARDVEADAKNRTIFGVLVFGAVVYALTRRKRAR